MQPSSLNQVIENLRSKQFIERKFMLRRLRSTYPNVIKRPLISWRLIGKDSNDRRGGSSGKSSPCVTIPHGHRDPTVADFQPPHFLLFCGFHSFSLFYCILSSLVPLTPQPIGDIKDGVFTNPFSPHPAARGMSEIKIS